MIIVLFSTEEVSSQKEMFFWGKDWKKNFSCAGGTIWLVDAGPIQPLLAGIQKGDRGI